MARIRTIKPQFFTSEDVTAQPPLARLLFVGLFTEADRDGRIEDRPKTLKMRLLPGDDVDVDALLWSLVDGGLIRRYEANGVRAIQVCAFEKHQRPHPKEPVSILPKDGTDTLKPCKETASRGQVVMVPVENPSSPVGRSMEYGDPLREGEEREPKARSRVQGNGAFEPGSLPRDHMHHSVCGPSLRVCLTVWGCGVLMQQYGGDPSKQKAAVKTFVSVLEQSMGPDDTAGSFSDIEKNFKTWMKSVGRTPMTLTLNGSTVNDQIDEWAKS